VYKSALLLLLLLLLLYAAGVHTGDWETTGIT